MKIENLRVKLFADGADVGEMMLQSQRPYISGFTTNPTLMRRDGVTDYRAFAHAAIAAIPDKPISFEVFSDELAEMERQAREIASWGENVYVKIPITNTDRESTLPVIHALSHDGIKVNVTALMTLAQVTSLSSALSPHTPSYVSVFAGRIADTGIDPIRMMTHAVQHLSTAAPMAQLIWASPRELLNVFQANAIGCHIITATSEILNKIPLIGRDLSDYSLETVKMFRDDAVRAGYTI